MKYALAILLVLSGLTVAIAQLCPDTPAGYIRQYRPAGEPANHPPSAEPVCYQRGTNEAGSYISCYLCHDYMQRRSA